MNDTSSTEYSISIADDVNNCSPTMTPEMNKIDYQAIFDNINVGLHIYCLEDINDDTTLRMIYANPATADLTGVPVRDVVGRTLDENFPGLREKGIPQTYADVVRTGKSAKLRDIYYSDARVAQGAFSAFAFPLPDNCVGISFENITERNKAVEELEKNRNELQLLFDNMLNGFAYHRIITDERGTPIDYVFHEVNKAFERITGLRRKDIIGRRATQVYPGIEAMDFNWIKTYGNVALTGEPIRFEQYFAPQNNWYLISAYCPQKGYFALTFEDCTDRVTAKKMLEESEERFRTLFNRMPSGAAVYEAVENGENFIIKEFNQAAEQIERIGKDRLLGKRVTEIFPGVADFGLLEVFQRVWKSGKAEFFPASFYKDEHDPGSWRENWIYKLPSGNIVALYNDVTDRIRSQEKLQESELKFRLLAETMDDVFLMSTRGGDKMVYINPSYEKLWERSRSDLYQNPRTFLESVHPDDLDHFIDVRDTYHKNGKPYECEYRIVLSDGEVRWIHEKGSPVPEKFKGEFLMAGVCSNITSQKTIEKEKLQLEQQVQQSQKLESIGRLAGGIAHDFNNMLNVILGYGQELMDELHPGDPLRDAAKEIMDAGMRSAALTRQLLAFSRRQTLQPEVVDFNALIHDLEKMIRRLIGEDIELVTRLADDLCPVRVDSGQIEQVIMNIAVNARDAMPQGGKLIIQTENIEIDEHYSSSHLDISPGNYIKLSIADNGCGMDEETRRRVFEPFFTTKEKGKGTGLGLSTVYGIVRQSGGNIWVYSEPGQGTIMKMYFPQTTEATSTDTMKKERETLSGRGETILVVEDEPSLRKLCQRILTSLNYNVCLASNGGEALLAVEEQKLRPDLLVTDVVMPEMSGRVLVERLRESIPDLKALYMSGYTDDAIVHHGILDSGTPFLQKPFTKSQFGRTVRKILDA